MDDVTTESGIKRSLAAAAARLLMALATSLRVVQQRTQRSLQRRAG
jgi:hypothetical protein